MVKKESQENIPLLLSLVLPIRNVRQDLGGSLGTGDNRNSGEIFVMFSLKRSLERSQRNFCILNKVYSFEVSSLNFNKLYKCFL